MSIQLNGATTGTARQVGGGVASGLLALVGGSTLAAMVAVGFSRWQESPPASVAPAAEMSGPAVTTSYFEGAPTRGGVAEQLAGQRTAITPVNQSAALTDSAGNTSAGAAASAASASGETGTARLNCAGDQSYREC